jgi:hypothetical protein
MAPIARRQRVASRVLSPAHPVVLALLRAPGPPAGATPRAEWRAPSTPPAHPTGTDARSGPSRRLRDRRVSIAHASSQPPGKPSAGAGLRGRIGPQEGRASVLDMAPHSPQDCPARAVAAATGKDRRAEADDRRPRVWTECPRADCCHPWPNMVGGRMIKARRVIRSANPLCRTVASRQWRHDQRVGAARRSIRRLRP